MEAAAGAQKPALRASNPIRLVDLDSHISRMDQVNGFRTEFETLGSPYKQLRAWTVASSPANRRKHIYCDILAYDESRVILTSARIPGAAGDNDNYSDFINANWINAYTESGRPGGWNKYIATQGPLSTTIDDFYRMIWEYNVEKVVMLASQHDLDCGRCTKYFPDVHDHEVRGGVTIELQSKQEFPDQDIVVRTYSLKKSGWSRSRVLVHHHFTSWPDWDVPSDPAQLLNLISKYRATSDSATHTPAGPGPVLVHCRGGVGRTGTFLLADAMYDMAKERQCVDFLGHLNAIRGQRVALVENHEQYRLAHTVVLEAYKKGMLG